MTSPQDPHPSLTADLAVIGAAAIHEFADRLRTGNAVPALPASVMPAPHRCAVTTPGDDAPTRVIVRPVQGEPLVMMSSSPLAPVIAGLSAGVAAVGLAWWLVANFKHALDATVAGVGSWSWEGPTKIAGLVVVMIIVGFVIAAKGHDSLSR